MPNMGYSLFVVGRFHCLYNEVLSMGNQTCSIGYKAHIAVDERGIPVSFVTTGVCVHDSLLAITLLFHAQACRCIVAR